MAGWRDSLDDSSAAAAPTGLKQQTVPGNEVTADGQPTASWRGSVFAADDPRRQPRWQTGGQSGSIQNGWDTPFYQKMFEQQKSYADRNELNAWYDDDKFTGIATWDQAGKKFGDVYEDGVLKGNILDPESGYDEDTAYQMLAQLTLSAQEQKHAYEGGTTKEAVTARAAETQKNVDAYATQQAYQKNVSQLKKDWGDASWIPIAVGGAGSGAAIGAAGFAATPLVGAVTTIGGALVGAGAALLNQDQIEDQAARASVQTGMAAEQFGPAGALSTGLRQWGGVAGQVAQPLSNTVQGLTDLGGGSIGDDVSTYYTMTDRPLWLTGLNLGAGFADAVLQFASPTGQALYLGTMGATTAGGVGQLTTQGGATFDDRTGQFDAPDDLGQWAAAVGAVGIDALQLGGGRAIGQLARSTGGARYGDSLLGKINPWMKEGTEVIGGRVFTRAADGTMSVRKAPSITTLAPSEGVQWMTVRAEALRSAAKEGRTITADDLYKAAKNLANGTRPVKQALVNAFGEGTEEGVQAMLEPLSHGWDFSWTDVAEAYASGAAMGAGMSIGARLGRGPGANRSLDQINVQRAFLELPEYTPDEWAAKSPEERKSELVQAPIIRRILEEQARGVQKQQERVDVRSVAGLDRLNMAYNEMAAAELKNSIASLTGTQTIAHHPSADLPARSAVGSLRTVQAAFARWQQGLQENSQRQELDQEQRDAYARIATKVQAVREALQAGEVALTNAGDNAQVRSQIIDAINTQLQTAWASEDRDLAKAVSLFFARNPWDNAGSVQAMMPQVSMGLTEQGAYGDGLWMIGDGVLPGMSADFDGDMFQHLGRLVVDDKAWLDARTGQSALGADEAPNVPLRENEAMEIRRVGVAFVSQNADLGNAGAMLEHIRTSLNAQLATIPHIQQYTQVLVEEMQQGVVTAKLRFMQRLATEQPDAMLELAQSKVVDPWLEIIDQTINQDLQAFQSSAANRQANLDLRTPMQAVPTAVDYRQVQPSRAATPQDTIALEAAGVDMLRAWQSVHYSKYRSETLESAFTETDSDIRQYLVQWYEMLSGGMTKSALDNVLAVDEVQQRARASLNRIAQAYFPSEGQARAVELTAGLQIPNVDRAGRYHGGYISVAQAVLRDSAEFYAARDSAILEQDVELARKYDLYRSMNPGEAIIEILGSQPIAAILGEAANNLASMTVDQAKAFLVNRSPDQRRIDFQQLKSDGRYQQAATHDLPYAMDEVEANTITGYQIFVDALAQAVNETVSMNEDGTVTGRLGAQTQRVQEQLEVAFTNVRRGLESFRKVLGGKFGRKATFDQQMVARVLDQNPDVAAPLLALFPNEIVNIVILEGDNGTVSYPSWFYEMLAEPNAKKAVMIFYRETLIAQLQAQASQHTVRRSDDRLVALAGDIINNDPTGHNWLAFQDLLMHATDVTEFMKDVNSKFVFDQAPIPAWHRDAALIDPSATQGGWSRALPGSKQREAFTKLSQKAQSFYDLSLQEEQVRQGDATLVGQLLQAVDQEDNDRDTDSRNQLRRLEKMLEDAGVFLPTALGPNTAQQMVTMGVGGIGPNLTDKGKPTSTSIPLGKWDALGATPVWGIGEEQMISGTIDAQDAARNITSLNRGRFRLQLDDGSIVEWKPITTAKEFLTAWRDPEMVPLLRALVFPALYEAQPSGQLSQQFLTGLSLTELLDNKTYLDLLTGTSNRATSVYASMIDALSGGAEGHMELTRWAMMVAKEYANASATELTPEQWTEIKDQAYRDVVQATRIAADMSETMLERELRQAIADLNSGEPTGPQAPVINAFRKSFVSGLEAEVQELERTGASAEEILDARKRVQAGINLFQAQTGDVARVIKQYTIDWADTQTIDSKLEEIYADLLDREGYIHTASGTDGDAARQILASATPDPFFDYPIVSASESEKRELWEAAARALAQVKIDEMTTALVIGRPTAAVSTNPGRLKFWDDSRMYLLEPLLREGSPLLAAARKFRTQVLGEDAQPGSLTEDLSRALGSTFLRPEIIDPKNFSTSLVASQVEGQSLIDASGSEAQVQMGGISYDKQDAITGATERTDADPADAEVEPRTVKFRLDTLMDDTSMIGSDPLMFLNGRFMVSARVHTVDSNGVRQEFDLMTDSNVQPGYHSNATPNTLRSPYMATSVNALRRAVDGLNLDGHTRVTLELEIWHPADKPASEDYANNVYFDGVLFENTGDIYASLNSAAYFSPLGIAQTAQRKALDARKKATQAIKQPSLPTYEQLRSFEDINDVYGTIVRKTMDQMRRSTGHGKLNPTLYNAVLSQKTLVHAIRATYTDDAGNIVPVLLTANQVIAHQSKNPGLPQVNGKDLENAELLELSSRTLRSLLGDTSDQGLRRPITDLETDIQNWGAYKGAWDQDAVLRIAPGLINFKDGAWVAGDIRDSDLVRRPSQTQFTLNTQLTDGMKALYDQKFEIWGNARYKGQIARRKDQDRWRGQANELGQRLMSDADLKTTMPFLSAAEWGLASDYPASIGTSPAFDMIEGAIRAALNDVTQGSGLSTIWMYDHGQKLPGGRETGILHGIAQLDPRKEDHHESAAENLLPGDTVAVNLATFDSRTNVSKELRAVVDKLSGLGVNIVFHDTSGQRDAANEVGRYLSDNRGYTRLAGSATVFVPQKPNSQYQTIEARLSRLGQTEIIQAKSMIAVMQTRNTVVRENTAIHFKARRGNGKEIMASRNLVPTTAYQFFGQARTLDDAKVLQDRMSFLASAEGAQDLRRLVDLSLETDGVTNPTPELIASMMDDLKLRFEYAAANLDPSTGLPAQDSKLRTGDIVGMVNPRGDIIFYRHGTTPIRSYDDVKKQLGSWGPGKVRVAMYGAKVREQSTVRDITITRWIPTGGYGLSVEGFIPLQSLGNKDVYETTGFKSITIPAEDTTLTQPDHDFIPGWSLDRVVNLDDSISKANERGRIDNFRNAFGYIGADFVPAYAEVLLGIPNLEALPAKEQQDVRAQVLRILREAGRQAQLSTNMVNDMQLSSSDPKNAASLALQTALGADSMDAFGIRTDAFDALTRDDLSPAESITRAALIYMLWNQADPAHVMSSTGLGFTSSTVTPTSTLMPELFTQALERGGARRDSDLRRYLFDMLNRQLTNGPQDPNGPTKGYKLRPDWTFVTYSGDGNAPLEGLLQFVEVHSSGHNPTVLEMAQARNMTDSASYQQASIAQQAFRMSTGVGRKLRDTKRYIDREGLETADTPVALYRLMRGLAPRLPERFGPKATRAYTPGERIAMKNYSVAYSGFIQPLDLSFWEDAGEKLQFTQERRRVLQRWGMNESDTGLIDTWIRGMLGSPKDRSPETEAAEGRVYFRAAMEALREIDRNFEHGRLPTTDAEVPLIQYSDLFTLYQNSKSGGWSPKDSNGDPLTEWDDWITLAIGTAKSATVDPFFMPAINGALQTYRNSEDSLAGLPIALTTIDSLGLLDATTADLVISLNPDDRTLFESAQIFSAQDATFADLYGGGQLNAGRYTGAYPPASAMARRRKGREQLRKSKDMAPVQEQSLENIMATGIHYRNSGTLTSSLMRIMVNMRAANGMANPWLYASAPVEAFARLSIQNLVNMATGEAVGGITGKAQISSVYSPEVLEAANEAINALSKNREFKSMVSQDSFSHPHLDNANAVEKFTAGVARFMGKWQDPTYGMRAKQLAKTYVETVLSYYAQRGTQNDVNLAELMTELQRSPLAVRRQDLAGAHQMALNRISNMRGLKATTASLIFRSVVDPLASNPHFLINVPSTLFLKIPYLFQNYAFNLATNMLGLQGIDASLSLLMQGRTGGKGWGKVMATLAGDRGSTEHGVDFLAETMESIDFADAFIKGGMTHTSLMALGLLAGNLGLTGEDEEDRRRRRMEQVSGVGHVYDPRDILNDFRNAESIWFDNIPFLSAFFKVGTTVDGEEGSRSPAEMHWTLKQFTSPALGIARFFEGGDFSNVIWGFEDALGSMPLVNTMLYDDSVKVANELYAASLDSEARGTPEDLAESSNFLLNGVMKLERMLAENSFVNSWYVAADKWDRDPYTLPDIDKEGIINRDNLSTPMETQALNAYIDPETGEVKQGSVGRDWAAAQLRSYSERQATLAFFGSLFTGFNDQNSLWRYSMPVKERTIEKPELSDDEAEALVMSMWDPKNKHETLTDRGAEAVIRGMFGGTVKPGDPSLEGTFISLEQRDRIKEMLQGDLIQEGLDLGLTKDQAVDRMYEFWNGSSTNPYAVPLSQVVYSTPGTKYEGSIPYSPNAKYRQLNTTYVTGPDGMPWATGIGRGELLNFFGQAPLQQFENGMNSNIGVDERLNSTDPFSRINTGMRGLYLVNDTLDNPTDEDILAAINKIPKAIADINSTGNGGYSRFGRSGGGGGGGGYAYRLNSPVRNDALYGRTIPYVNVDNPILRRATIRRERFSSTRGRLNQWQ